MDRKYSITLNASQLDIIVRAITLYDAAAWATNEKQAGPAKANEIRRLMCYLRTLRSVRKGADWDLSEE